MNDARKESGSFRDPSGNIFVTADRVYRTVMPRAVADFDFIRSTNVWKEMLREGLILSEEQVDPKVLGNTAKRSQMWPRTVQVL